MIRSIYLILSLIIISNRAFCQQGWAMLRGQPSGTQVVSGIKKQPHHNNTPALKNGMTWSLQGKLYLYGNRRYVADWGTSPLLTTDMWCFDTLTNNWTWLSGRNHDTDGTTNNVYLFPVFGTKGVASPANTPGFKQDAVTWVLDGKLYMYGGRGIEAVYDPRSELWMYDPATNYWTWLGGDLNDHHAVFGISGVAKATNHPGGLIKSNSWVRNSKLYLFGGTGYDSLNYGPLNDIWEYDPVTTYWTWIKGDKKVLSGGSVGTKGVSSSTNAPSHHAKTGWYAGNKYYVYSRKGDELLEFDFTTTNWTWIKGDSNNTVAIYGSKNISNSSNTPGLAVAKSTWVLNNKLYLYGDSVNNTDAIWEYNPSNGNWTWINGDTVKNGKTDWGIHKYADTNTVPRGMLIPHTWELGNKIYLMYYRYSDAIWEYNTDTKMWRWIKGTHNGWSQAYSLYPLRSHQLHEPHGNNQANCWQINDTMYTYLSDSSTNALWRYDMDKNVWALINVTHSDTPRYGTKGVGSVYNSPGHREQYSTAHVGNKLYMYGGRSHYSATATQGLSNQLWEFDLDTKAWTMLNGRDTIHADALYGTKNVGHANNTPGAMYRPVFWAYNNKLFLYGSRLLSDYPNSVWEYDLQTNHWKYIKGDLFADKSVHGQKGVAASQNHPGERVFAGYSLINDKLYLFGGDGYSRIQAFGPLNDLWEYNHSTNNWRWLKGEDTASPPTIFGVKRVSSSSNTPGRRVDSKMAVVDGKIYLFSGWGTHSKKSISTEAYILDDLWEYDVITNNWTWIDGTQGETAKSVYEHVSVFDTLNHVSGCFYYNSVWGFKTRFYIHGSALAANADTIVPKFVNVNSVWCYETCKNLQVCYAGHPVIKLDSIVTMCGRAILLNAGNIGSKYLWNTSDTTQHLIVASPGKYWVRVTNPGGNSTTDTVIVVLGSATPVNLGNDTLICDNDSILLNTNVTMADYVWNTGDTSASIYGRKGKYKIHVVYNNGCYTSDSIIITTKPAPVKPIISSNSPLCTGDSLYIKDSITTTRVRAGYYKAGVFTGVNSSNYFSGSVNLSDSGIYYLVDTLNGCMSSDTTYVEVDSTYTPSVSIHLSPGNHIGPYVPLTFTSVVNYGFDSSHLQWYKNGAVLTGETNDSYNAITYTDIVTGDIICVGLGTKLQCALSDTATDCAQPIIVDLSINESGSKQTIHVYPNPVDNILHIEGINEGAIVELFDIVGRKCSIPEWLNSSKQNLSIDMSSLPKGNYVLKITDSDGTKHISKIIK